MKLKVLKPRKALNKAFLKLKPNRNQIEHFKTNLTQLLDRTNNTESEEFHKNLVSDFLKKTYYEPNHFINTKGRNDLVIHNGDKAKSTVGVIIEAKKPTNKSEMLTKDKINVKAFQELVLYYLRERITLKNLEVKHMIATNINEWFIFDAHIFEKYFAHNKVFVKQFNEFENERLAGKSTDFFYNEIAAPFIDNLNQEIEFTYFDIRWYEKPLRNENPKDDTLLIALFKLLSPEHLLKLPFTNDSNSLDKSFYGELLHIIGLSEIKQGSKKLIERNKEGQRNTGSLLENAIIQLDSLDKISRLDKPAHFGDTQQERLFNISLELCIIWVNRILFLKLLEAQLLTYHNGDKSFEYLSLDKIPNYDDLNSLFFQVLARKLNDRNDDVKTIFEKVPYLNSSLFDPTDLEHKTIFISNLRDDKTIPIYSSTVLKDDKGKKRTGKLCTLQYLFEFLNAYDFSSEGSEEIQEENKTLINASVLGLIFEKINGYKDGSFFTPGFITMYMCRETIRKAVVQKFNETKNWDCNDIESLYDKIENRQEANEIVNSLKICDPAVGSGHFLVSALNEIIAIKNDLKILQDRAGRRLKEYQVEVVNDELIVTDEDGELFEYKPASPESSRVQQALFHEKQTLIENCLFGVDINPNSVKICRLRLWIELLKSAYYKNATELETLPNIDINIKCGNSLISRFAIDADLGKALNKSKWTIESYRLAVDTYRNAQNKEQKREMEKLISDIKSDFRSEISFNDSRVKRLKKISGEIFTMANQTQMFEMTKKEKAEWNTKLKKLSLEEKKLETQIAEIKNNVIYEDAFEWRFEFPEVLNDKGDFVGFDVVMGNPPYVPLQHIPKESEEISKLGFQTFHRTADLYVLFCERGNQILRQAGIFSMIIPNKWISARYGINLRTYLIQNTNPVKIIDFEKVFIFDEAVVFVCIFEFQKIKYLNQLKGIKILNNEELATFDDMFKNHKIQINNISKNPWEIVNSSILKINSKIEDIGTPLSQWKGIEFYRGITTGYNMAFHIDQERKDKIISEGKNSSQLIKPLLRGKDIKRYNYQYQNLFIIFTKRGLEIDNYPEIKKHLAEYYEDLLPKNKRSEKKGRKPGNYKWYEIQDNTAYYREFEKEKIVWIEISDKANYTFDSRGMYLTNSAYFISGRSLEYLLAVLNSKLCDFYFFQKTATIAGGRKRYTKQYVEQNCIPDIEEESQKPFIDLVNQILILRNVDFKSDTKELESQIDQLVYQLYGLTEEEITIVENSVKK